MSESSVLSIVISLFHQLFRTDRTDVGYVLGSPVSPPPFHSPMRSFIGGTKLNLASAEDAHELFDDLPLVLSTGLDGVGYTVFNVSLEYHEAD